MKKIKKFLLTMAMTMALGTSAFASSGFEFLLNWSGGLKIGIPNKAAKTIGYEKGGGFDTAITAQIGYMFQVKDGFGISVLGELGYSHDTISGTYSKIEGGDGISFSGIKAIYTLEQFQIGLLPKFNIGAFSIGIGGGVKIPISAKERVKIDSLGIDEKSKFKPADAVQGYIKLTFDYSLFFTDNLAMNFGLYLGYDTPLTATARDASYFTALFERVNVHDFNVGLQLGFRFGPKA